MGGAEPRIMNQGPDGHAASRSSSGPSLLSARVTSVELIRPHDPITQTRAPPTCSRIAVMVSPSPWSRQKCDRSGMTMSLVSVRVMAWVSPVNAVTGRYGRSTKIDLGQGKSLSLGEVNQLALRTGRLVLAGIGPDPHIAVDRGLHVHLSVRVTGERPKRAGLPAGVSLIPLTARLDRRHSQGDGTVCRAPPATICDNPTTRLPTLTHHDERRVVIDSEEIREARRALGRQLAAYREAAGLIQQELAPKIHYGRSTIANVEIGRQRCSRAFWEHCDQVLVADGALIRGYDELKAFTRAQQVDIARRME